MGMGKTLDPPTHESACVGWGEQERYFTSLPVTACAGQGAAVMRLRALRVGSVLRFLFRTFMGEGVTGSLSFQRTQHSSCKQLVRSQECTIRQDLSGFA